MRFFRLFEISLHNNRLTKTLADKRTLSKRANCTVGWSLACKLKVCCSSMFDLYRSFTPVFGRVAVSCLFFYARPISFRYTSHMATVFTYRTPTRHALLAVQQEGLAVARCCCLDDPSPRPQCAVNLDRNLKPKLAIMRQCTSVTDRRTDRRTLTS